MFKSKVFFNIAIRLCGGLALLTLACISASAAGEEASMEQPLTPGMRVRILAPDVFAGKVVGTVNMVNDTSVSIDVKGRAEPVSVPREKIARLDVSTGPRSRWVDAAIGAGIGAVGGAVAGGSQDSHVVSNGEVAAVCALLGAGLGALIGAAIPPGEHWSEMMASRYRLSFAPRLDHGLGLAVAWGF
jgi:hypothetical protein